MRVAGDIRQTQLITTFGAGAIVDFVRDTVMIAGVDDWDTGKNADDLDERKLYSESLKTLTGANYFLSPKISNSTSWVKSRDIPAYTFPEYLYCPTCKRIITAKEAANANPKRPNKCCLNNEKTGKKCTGTLVASRFVIACENGHIEDFPYSWWIHGDESCSASRTPRISMYNIGNRSDIDSLWIKCDDCGKSRSMAGAFSENALGGENGYRCNSNHPHLKSKHTADSPECCQKLKTRLRSSSGIYYPITLSALKIPPWSREAVKIIEKNYEALVFMGDNAKAFLQSKANSSVSHDELIEAFEIVKRLKGETSQRNEMDIYNDEYKVLMRGDAGNHEGDYSAFTVDIPANFKQFFEQVTVVDKLTVIEALRGFTRLKPWGGDVTQIAPLSTYPKDWLPAVELRGEGVFICFNANALEKWKTDIGNRYEKMDAELQTSYLKNRKDRFSPEYVLLHTFAHLFIRQIANECGYSTASIKEKIYSTFTSPNDSAPKMHGVLIHLASSDSDGSLGGLISIVQNTDKFQLILENMLKKALWCSADPLCITSMEQGFSSLNYSACHDCVLLPETSCEYRNVLLDRVSVVGTVEHRELGFMGKLAEML